MFNTHKPDDPNYKTSITSEAVEEPDEDIDVIKRDLTRASIRYRCLVGREIVGYRSYMLKTGNLCMESAVCEGRNHGYHYELDETDLGRAYVEWREKWVKGQKHGYAFQYNDKGQIIGRCKFINGTGFDVWRGWKHQRKPTIDEISWYRDGACVCQWCFDECGRLRYEGVYHDLSKIQRYWNARGSLERCEFYLGGKKTTNTKYLAAYQKDKDMPPYREEDNLSQRKFPRRVRELFRLQKSRN